MELDSHCPRSYLLGFFFGDGSSKSVGKYYQHCFYCCPEDLQRVDENAKLIGVELNWRVSVKGKTVMVATWPSAKRGLLGLEGLQGSNCYSRRLSMAPIWVDWHSFMEGFWDADGFVSIRPRKESKSMNKKLGIFIVNKGLATDIRDKMVGWGFDPTLNLGFNGRGESTAQVTIVSKDYPRFRSLFKLQAKKQAMLDSL